MLQLHCIIYLSNAILKLSKDFLLPNGFHRRKLINFHYFRLIHSLHRNIYNLWNQSVDIFKAFTQLHKDKIRQPSSKTRTPSEQRTPRMSVAKSNKWRSNKISIKSAKATLRPITMMSGPKPVENLLETTLLEVSGKMC